jgi:ribosomal protein L27
VNTYTGKDFTIHALVDGVVAFSKKKRTRFDGRKYLETYVHVVPAMEAIAAE